MVLQPFAVALGDNNVSIFKVMATVRRGTLGSPHPSGALSYKWKHGTAVGTWEDNTFKLIRFYD